MEPIQYGPGNPRRQDAQWDGCQARDRDSGSSRVSAPSTRKTNGHRDVPGLIMCPESLPAAPRLPHIVIPGTPRRRQPGASLPARHEAAARAGSAVAVLPASLIDRAARATLGRRRRPRRPGLKQPLALPVPVPDGAETQRLPAGETLAPQCATLGRQGRPGRPGLKEPGSGLAGSGSGSPATARARAGRAPGIPSQSAAAELLNVRRETGNISTRKSLLYSETELNLGVSWV